ncbi:MAG TPA: 16S rRNA (cytosine(967)-C(5))-methyltransferase RsmB [Alloacidobacterium sp.]|nr:16S rRNA (cytosine(967)-C(5))-methyltransferase RsmB [Alloacidobacterium sp.]
MSSVAPARSAAFEILLAVERGVGHSDELLHEPSMQKLSPPDRNLATNLVMGVLRWQIALDAQIDALLSRPDTRLDATVRMALRIGAFQLLYLDRVPVYAAIGESVELAKSAKNRFAAGMVNAILRKIAVLKNPGEPAKFIHPSELAKAYAHPEWLVNRWIKNFGFEAAKRICEYDQKQAPVFVRLLTREAEEQLSAEGVELAPANFLTNVRSVAHGDVVATKAFRSGLVRIQDEGSQLVAELAGNGRAILDACAAPGGKTAILAERNPEAEVTACDVSRRRLQQMESMLQSEPFRHRIEFVTADVAKTNFHPEFDLVLCDAPCSGTGTLARNPEIRHRLDAQELKRQQKRQVEILSSVMRAVEPGGKLLYSTCSLEPEENEAVIEECLGLGKDFELVPMEREIERLENATVLTASGAKQLRDSALADGYLRTLPGTHQCDGFFAALLTRQN